VKKEEIGRDNVGVMDKSFFLSSLMMIAEYYDSSLTHPSYHYYYYKNIKTRWSLRLSFFDFKA